MPNCLEMMAVEHVLLYDEVWGLPAVKRYFKAREKASKLLRRLALEAPRRELLALPVTERTER